MKILVAVDGSHVTKRMLSYMAAQDELLGAGHDYTFITVVPLISARVATFLQSDVIQGYYRDEAEKVFAPIRQFVEQNGWRAHMISNPGHAPETIAKTANEGHFGLLVMGTHGHGSLTNLVLGSVATAVLARVKVPVLLVPSS